jgi:hypothetical protein
MARRKNTLQIGMIDGDISNVQDEFYYAALQEEVTLRIYE